MIKSIELKNIATFSGEGDQINNLQKINFIYGANGSGKTTVSNLLDNENSLGYEDCTLKWHDDTTLDTLVYNKGFRERNFGNNSLDGVFTLGQATKEDLEKIEDLRSKIDNAKESLAGEKQSLASVEKGLSQDEIAFRNECWSEIYKVYESKFKEAYVKAGSKERFANRLLQESGSNSTDLQTLGDLEAKAQSIFGDRPTVQQEIEFTVPKRINEIETSSIWDNKILGKSDVPIAPLIQTLGINDWVHQGQQYLQDDETCPFCQEETITDTFRSQIEAYFDKTFIEQTEALTTTGDEYIDLVKSLIQALKSIEAREKESKETKIDLIEFSNAITVLESQFQSNNVLITSKIKEPSRSISLQSLEEQIVKINGIVEEANLEIKKHNLIASNYTQERDILISSIWKYFTETYKAKITNYIKKKDGKNEGIKKIKSRIKAWKVTIRDTELMLREQSANVTSIETAVENINSTLTGFGFKNFKIVQSPDHEHKYQIQRESGELAQETLSEGEITFVTFLYYIQLVSGGTTQDNVMNDRILVIDDPISSLDSNVLFVVSVLIKNIIKKIKSGKTPIKQLIVLTHNVYFHNEVSHIDGRNPDRKDTYFWILRKDGNVSSVESFEMKNPIGSSYSLLWQELKSENPSKMTVQNVMRRIIESYFKILGRYGDDTLIASFENEQEKEICRSLLCWVNDGSHGIPDDLFIEHNDNTVDQYFVVFRKIFEKMRHLEHFRMMFGEEEKEMVYNEEQVVDQPAIYES